MDISTTASSIIDRAITLKEGGVIVIPCSSYEEMENLRVRLYKVRRQLGKKYDNLAKTLDITRRAKESNWTLYISKEAALTGVFIVEEGETKPFINEEDVKTEEERIAFLKKGEMEREMEMEMEREEEVEVKMGEKKEKDFDEVATEIERAQNLTTEE